LKAIQKSLHFKPYLSNAFLSIQCISEPNLIKRDPERDEVFYYYRLTGRSIFRRDDIYMSAVVERSEGNKVGRILTAHLVRQPRKDGEVIWFNLQQKSR
jgi:hypothetical protein